MRLDRVETCTDPHGPNQSEEVASTAADDDLIELKSLIKKISAKCQICKLYKKTPPEPIIDLPMATAFQESVAMDLKFIEGKSFSTLSTMQPGYQYQLSSLPKSLK